MGKAQLQCRISGRVAVYHRANPGAPVRVVAMHGALRSAADLAIMVTALAPHADLWLIDLPGHGNAPYVPDNGGFDPEILAHDIAAALAAAPSAAPAVILGESFSGITALRLAARLANVQHVILLDTPLDTTRCSRPSGWYWAAGKPCRTSVPSLKRSRSISSGWTSPGGTSRHAPTSANW